MQEGSSVEQFAMRSRAVRTSSSEGFQNDAPTYKDIVLIERKVKNGDTLNKLAIKYQVNVSFLHKIWFKIQKNKIFFEKSKKKFFFRLPK